MDFGTTCPLLNISRAFDVDYERVLRYADGLIHKRRWQEGVATHKMPLKAIEAIEDHANKFNRLRHGLDA